MNVRDVNIVSDDTQPMLVETPRASALAPPMIGEPVVGQPVVVAEVPPHETVQVRSSLSISPAAVVAAIGGIALLLFGAINVARAGVDGSWRDPVVQVAGYEGTALLGLISLVAGLVLLGAALSRNRGAILFVSILLGVAGATLAIEPTVGGDLVAAESSFGVAVLIMSIVIVVVALVAPSVRRSSNRIERA